MIALELTQQEAGLLGAILTAVVAAVGYLGVARMGGRSTEQAGQITLRAQDLDRMAGMEKRIDALEDDLGEERAYSRSMWTYCRHLIDQYYKYRQPGSPDPDPLPDDPSKR